MPFKRKRFSKSKTKAPTRSEVAKIAKKVVLGTAETKQVYTEVDEQTITPGTNGLTINNFMNISRIGTDQLAPKDGQNSKREGAEIIPRSFQFRGWMRPRALANDGTGDDKDSDQFDNALYVRIIIIKASTLTLTDKTPTNTLTPDDDNFFLGLGGLPTGLSTDYSDIYKPLNWKATGKPLMDKVVFIPNQYKMNNTKLIKFNHKFGPNEKLNFLENASTLGGASVIPDETIRMHIIARYANDDIHVQYENLELSGTGIFKFKDF
jgi:hypothetical protein